jgi:hypothetical protein
MITTAGDCLYPGIGFCAVTADGAKSTVAINVTMARKENIFFICIFLEVRG